MISWQSLWNPRSPMHRGWLNVKSKSLWQWSWRLFYFACSMLDRKNGIRINSIRLNSSELYRDLYLFQQVVKPHKRSSEGTFHFIFHGKWKHRFQKPVLLQGFEQFPGMLLCDREFGKDSYRMPTRCLSMKKYAVVMISRLNLTFAAQIVRDVAQPGSALAWGARGR